MRHERFLAPLSESDPCGPDLDEIGDEDYLNYFLPAEGRLPSSFYDTKEQKLFDRATLDLRAELKMIDSLLSRSRDIRLIGLEARFQAFSGSIVGVSDCVQAIAAFVERFGDALHPRPLDEDDPVRQNTVGALDDRARIVLPMHYATLVRDKRLGTVTYRHYAVANKLAAPRAEETAPAAGDIAQALGSDENGEQTAAIHDAVVKSLAAMSAMRTYFQELSGYETAPSFGALEEFFEDLRKMLEAARPSLSPDPGSAEPDMPAPVDDAAMPQGAAAQPVEGALAPMTPVASASAILISSQREASAAMIGTESYFLAYEPSAPALILVRQARMLVGKPLVEVIEMLMPEAAERATIHLDPALKLQIGMSMMRSLSQEPTTANGAAGEEQGRSFETQTRAGAMALLSGVEEFYRRAEPSSPIPMLLARARGYMNRDFTMILNDLIAKEGVAN